MINMCLDFSDPASNPHLLPATPLQNPLPLPDIVVTAAAAEPEQSLRPRKASDASDHTVGSTDGSGSDACSTCSVETTQSSVIVEESSSETHDGHAKEPSSESSMTPVEDEVVPTTTPDAEEAPVLVQPTIPVLPLLRPLLLRPLISSLPPIRQKHHAWRPWRKLPTL